VIAISLLRRLLGLAQPEERPTDDADAGAEPGSRPGDASPGPPAPGPAAPRVDRLACPSCAVILDPPPSRNRLCPRCRQPIVVRRVDGRLVLLTEQAVVVFEAERRHEADKRGWEAARRRWLGLAATVSAPASRRTKLAKAPPSAAVVEASRTLYLAAAERAVKDARRGLRWGDVGQIRREQAAALYREAGSPVPPPDDVARLHREGMSAVLRSLAVMATDAEVVSAGCCRVCRADDGRIVRIASELRTPRLPHDGCPKGLCGCDWWIAVAEPKARRRRSTPRAAVPGMASRGRAEPTAGLPPPSTADAAPRSAPALEPDEMPPQE
jgi:hypothetical protein